MNEHVSVPVRAVRDTALTLALRQYFQQLLNQTSGLSSTQIRECNRLVNEMARVLVTGETSGVPRAHELTWAECTSKPCTHTLGAALGLDDERTRTTDALVNAALERDASLRDVVTMLAKREMTDAEFAVALYALGWFDHATRGAYEDNDD